jgi:hypothetical protein
VTFPFTFFPVPFSPYFFFPRTFSPRIFFPVLFSVPFFPVLYQIISFSRTFPFFLRFFSYFFSRTFSKVATFEIQRFEISVSCFSSTCYNTVHVPCRIAIQTSSVGLPLDGWSARMRDLKGPKMIFLTQKRMEMFYSTNQSYHWKLNQSEVAISGRLANQKPAKKMNSSTKCCLGVFSTTSASYNLPRSSPFTGYLPFPRHFHIL